MVGLYAMPTSEFWIANEARLIAAVREGKTASQIGIELGATRNAVIGRVNRIGLKLAGSNNRGGAPQRAARAQGTRKPIAGIGWTYRQKRPQIAVEQDLDKIRERQSVDRARTDLVSFAELEDNACKFPVGEKDYKFCGRERLAGLPYCGDHMQRCYLPPIERPREVRRFDRIATGVVRSLGFCGMADKRFDEIKESAVEVEIKNSMSAENVE